VGLEWLDGSKTWGAGTHTDITRAGAEALISAFNNKTLK
jgi:2-isopropylmalate synthase